MTDTLEADPVETARRAWQAQVAAAAQARAQMRAAHARLAPDDPARAAGAAQVQAREADAAAACQAYLAAQRARAAALPPLVRDPLPPPTGPVTGA